MIQVINNTTSKFESFPYVVIIGETKKYFTELGLKELKKKINIILN